MNDDLGEMMYAKTETECWARFVSFQLKYEDEQEFITYFYNTWMNRPGNFNSFFLLSNFFFPRKF
jgi:hypothetical protein